MLGPSISSSELPRLARPDPFRSDPSSLNRGVYSTLGELHALWPYHLFAGQGPGYSRYAGFWQKPVWVTGRIVVDWRSLQGLCLPHQQRNYVSAEADADQRCSLHNGEHPDLAPSGNNGGASTDRGQRSKNRIRAVARIGKRLFAEKAVEVLRR